MIEEGIMAEQDFLGVDEKYLKDKGDRNATAPRWDGNGEGDGNEWGQLDVCGRRGGRLLNLAGKDGRDGIKDGPGCGDMSSDIKSELVWRREVAPEWNE